ncbi:MAG TPA: DMT family transporter [Nostocaceae cyanobacterium]|nr:DMT family transporter [Nostocaceae cyanobacterium]
MGIIHPASKKTNVRKSSTLSSFVHLPSPFLFLALASGAVLPIQAAMNAQLARSIGSFPLAGDISYLVGTIVLLSLLLTGKFGQPNWPALTKAPWWAFCGGLMGAWYISSSAYFTATLGTTLTIALIISGQCFMGMLVDHFGWLGVPPRRFTANRRIAGALLLLAVFFFTLK